MRILGPVLTAHYLAAFTALGMPLFLPRVMAELAPSAPAWLVGVLYVLPTVCTALSATAWGRFADRHGRKLSLLRAQLGLALGFVLAGFAPNLGWFVFGLIVQGTCGGSMAAANAYLSTQAHGAALSRSLDWTQYSARLAMVTAPVLLGLITSTGFALELYRYLALLPILAFAITWLLPTDPAEIRTSACAAPAAPVEGLSGWIGVLAVQFMFCFAMVVSFPYFIPYGEQLGLLSDSLIGLLYSLPHLVYLVGMPWLKSISVDGPRASHRRLATGLALLTVACVAQGLLTEVIWLAPARLLYGVGMLLAFSGLNGQLGARAAQRPAGQLFGAFDACGKWAGAMAGIGAGWLVFRFDIAAPFFAAAAAAALALVTVALGSRTHNPRQDHAATSHT